MLRVLNRTVRELLGMRAPARGGRGSFSSFAGRFCRNRVAVVALLVLAAMVAVALVLPHLLPFTHEDVFWDSIKGRPTLAGWHLFGFDVNGRDMLVRTLLGFRVSLQVSLIATFMSLVIGVLYGAFAGYFGGRIDDAMMRFVDILYSMPSIIFIIMLMVVFGRSETLLYLGISIIAWPTMSRVVRGQTLSVKEREYVEAARALGVSTARIVLRHVIPNLAGPVVVYLTLTVPGIILLESFLSYLGFGVQEPRTSLGTLVSEGDDKLGSYPWMLYFPGGVLVLTLYCLLYIGEGMRNALDTRAGADQ